MMRAQFETVSLLQALKARAAAMLVLGFEQALERSNSPKYKYQWYSQCCSFTNGFQCRGK